MSCPACRFVSEIHLDSDLNQDILVLPVDMILIIITVLVRSSDS